MIDKKRNSVEETIIERRYATYVRSEEFLNNQIQFITYSLFGFSILVFKEFSVIENPNYNWSLNWAVVFFIISIIYLLNSYYITVTVSKCLYNLLDEGKKNEDIVGCVPVIEYKTLIPWMFKAKWYEEFIPLVNTIPILLFESMTIHNYIKYKKLDEDIDLKKLVVELESTLGNSVYGSSFYSRVSLFIGFFLLFIFLSTNIEKYSEIIRIAMEK